MAKLGLVMASASSLCCGLRHIQARMDARMSADACARIPSDGQTGLSGVSFDLANGVRMPAIGFGTWKLEGTACYNAVRWALELGLRHIDTAEAYGNEAEVGRALRDSGVPREELFLATKATSVALGMAEPAYLEAVFAGQLQAPLAAHTRSSTV